MKNKRGITLIALVITIILLLILAGITILQLTGNGLFGKVQLAKEKSEQAQAKENVTLKEYENYIENSREEISNQKGKWELLTSTTKTTETEYKVKDLKLFSEIALVGRSKENSILSSTIISYEIFKLTSMTYVNYYNGTSRTGWCSYIDDTNIKMKCQNTEMAKLELYGIY